MHQDERAIRELISTWFEATRNRDADGVLALVADDVVFLRPGQPPMRGKSAFADSQRSLQEFDFDATYDIQEIRVFGDVAYCWNKIYFNMTPRQGGATIKRAGDVLSVFQRRPSGWVLVRDANMLAEVKDNDKSRHVAVSTAENESRYV